MVKLTTLNVTGMHIISRNEINESLTNILAAVLIIIMIGRRN